MRRDEHTGEFKVVEVPNPYQNHFVYEERTQEFVKYEPVPARWTDYFVEPKVDLFDRDEATGVYFPVAEPSPHREYFTHDEDVNGYVPYEPVHYNWTDYYEAPPVELYKLDECS